MNTPNPAMVIHDPTGRPLFAAMNITNAAECSMTLMGEQYVRLSFVADSRVEIPAFSYVFHNDMLWFVKERYVPARKAAWQYDMKFVAFPNMLGKHLCMRYYAVAGEEIQPEPEIMLNGNLNDIMSIVMTAIHEAAGRVPLYNEEETVYAQMLRNSLLATDTLTDTPLENFSFQGCPIDEVLTSVADIYDTEWWVTYNDTQTPVLHLCKCQDMEHDPYVLTDIPVRDTTSLTHRYRSGGLQQVEYAQEWSDIPQRLLPYGSERNITRKQALDGITGSEMYVSYGRRLRLEPNTTYTVYDANREAHSITTDDFGAVTNKGVTTGIEQTRIYDDIYPQGHFVVTDVRHNNADPSVYTINALVVRVDADGKPMKDADGNYITLTNSDSMADGILPIQNRSQTEDLAIIFESGRLNGRQFTVRHHHTLTRTSSDSILTWSLSIVPEGDDDDGMVLPAGSFAPQEGDLFSIYNMDMPNGYVTEAQRRLAQAVYEELTALEATRPDVKCIADEGYFQNISLFGLGTRLSVYSDLFGHVQTDDNGQIDHSLSDVFTSRVTALSYNLTHPNAVQFTLSSSRVEGRLAAIETAIADHTSDIRGIAQRTQNLSKRGWHDAAELRDMLESLVAEMMLVGKEKNQFTYTMGIECVNNDNDTPRYFDYLNITAGYLQHTLSPYIDGKNGGRMDLLSPLQLTVDFQGNTLNDEDPYYLYAQFNSELTTIDAGSLILVGRDYNSSFAENDNALLLGVLSSVYEDTDEDTRYRIFNRTNGYTQITGGTITTEQIQDPTRSLIIDFASDPPRIIARDKAEIIGNIVFRSADGDKHYVGDELYNADGTLRTDYLTRALEDNARSAVSDIYGGLIATSLIRMRDPETGQGTAGLSGIMQDNILLWGGGDYASALDAVQGLSSLPVLLTKAGIGSNIGCLHVTDTDTVEVNNNDGSKTIISRKSISELGHVQLGGHADDYMANITSRASSFEGIPIALGTVRIEQTAAGKYRIELGSITVRYALEAQGYYEDQNHQYDAVAELDLYSISLYVTHNNVEVYNRIVHEESIRDYVDSGDSTVASASDTITIPVNFDEELTLGQGTIEVGLEATCTLTAYADNPNTAARAELRVTNGLHAYGIDRYTILAADGLQITIDAEHSFRIDNSGNKIAISVVGLPTAPTNPDELYVTREGYLAITPP